MIEVIAAVRRTAQQNTHNKIPRKEQSVCSIKDTKKFKYKSKEKHFTNQISASTTCEHRAKCPAKTSTCRACGKRGYQSAMCRSKKEICLCC